MTSPKESRVSTVNTGEKKKESNRNFQHRSLEPLGNSDSLLLAKLKKAKNKETRI